MKKALALLLAVAATMSVGVTALADDVNVIETVSSSSDAVSSDVVIEDDNIIEGGSSSEVVESAPDVIPEEEAPEAPAVDPSAFIFGADAGNDGAILEDTILEPGVEYKFPVSLTVGSDTVALSDAHTDDFKFTYSRLSSSSVKTFKIEEYKGVYYLFVEVKDSTPVKPVDVKYNVKMVRKSNNLSLFGQEVKFTYGYDESNGDYIDGLDKGDVVEIDNTKPVITKSQFDKIARINDYKNVTMSGPSWRFTVNVTDETTKNMISSNAGIKDVLAKLPDQEFKFFTFAGKPTFSATGKVALEVEDIVDDFAKMYTYRYADGKLYRLNATFNAEDNTLEFRTNKLDNFVVTDKLVKDGFVVAEGDVNDNDTTTDDETDSDKNNPTTGASDMINAAVAAAMVTLAGAGALAIKKSSK